MTAREEDRGIWLAPDWSGLAIEAEDGEIVEVGREHGDGAWVSQGMLDVVPDHWVRLVPMPDDEPLPEGQSPWDAYVAAYREYQETDPHGATAHPTAHHMHALEAALRVAASPLPDSETEWGLRVRGENDAQEIGCEQWARSVVRGHEGYEVVQRRAAGPWQVATS